MKLHRSPFAGTWYPGDAGELRELLVECFARSEERTGSWLPPDGCAFVVPHAGIAWSGTVAAAVYRGLAARRPRRIVILGFLHAGNHDGVWLPDCEAYQTPLGEVPVDLAGVQALARDARVAVVPHAAASDHSIEMQLPFLQWAAPEAAVLPLYVGRLPEPDGLLGDLLDGAVVLASSDWTHFGRPFRFQPFPADRHAPERLRELDYRAMEAASTLDAAFFDQERRDSGCTLCGYRPIGLLLRTLAGHDLHQEMLDYQTSGEITGNYDTSVSYAALGYFPPAAFSVSPDGRNTLLHSAREALEAAEQWRPSETNAPEPMTPELKRKPAVFVSLHHERQILGCVGTREGRWPLWRAVRELTEAAAVQDPRSRGVVWKASDVDIEISVLTPTRRLTGAAGFIPGRHGLVLECGSHQGLLLPQVGRRSPYDRRDQFLRALTLKAGGGPEMLHDPAAKLFAFEAQVFADRIS